MVFAFSVRSMVLATIDVGIQRIAGGSSQIEIASGKKICVRTHRLHPDAPGIQDALDVPCQCTNRSQGKRYRQCEFGCNSPQQHASGHRSTSHLLTRQSIAGHFHSGLSRVRVLSFWTQPCQCIFLLDASGRHVSWQHGHASCQGVECHSKYSGRIRKHAVGSRHSDSVQSYSLYLWYIHLYMLLHTSHFQQMHPATNPSPRSSHAVMLF